MALGSPALSSFFKKIVTVVDILTVRMPKGSSGGFYAVRVGKNPGIYLSWDECQKEVTGFPKARYKKFPTREQAQEFIDEGSTTATTSTSYSNGLSHTSNVRATFAPSARTATSASTSIDTGQHIAEVKLLSSNLCSTVTLLRQHIASGSNLVTSLQTSCGAGDGNNSDILRNFSQLLMNAGRSVDSLSSLFSQAATYSNKLEDNSKKRSRPTYEDDGNSASNKRSKVNNSGPTGGGQSGQKVAEVYTDGCCHSNGKSVPKGGISVYWGRNHPNNLAEKLLGRQTNNRAEIQAARKAIKQAKSQGYDKIIINTDSQFLINCITKWIKKWQRNDWKLANGKDVINRKDIEQLDQSMIGIEVEWRHVKGHSGIHGNEEADRLANEGAAKPYIKNFDDDESYSDDDIY